MTCFYNVRSVTSRGTELTFLWKLSEHLQLQWYSSAFFNRSTYDDDYVQSDLVVPTSGKTTVDVLQRILVSEIAWT